MSVRSADDGTLLIKLEIPGVVGVAQGVADGRPVVQILVAGRSPGLVARLPQTLDSHTGPFSRYLLGHVAGSLLCRLKLRLRERHEGQIAASAEIRSGCDRHRSLPGLHPGKPEATTRANPAKVGDAEPRGYGRA
jgi:hypothetical protein